MTKKPDPKDMPDALAYPPRKLHADYSRRGAAAAAQSNARRKRLAAATKEKSK